MTRKLLVLAALIGGLFFATREPDAGICNGLGCAAPIASTMCYLSSISSSTGLSTCSGGIPSSANYALIEAVTATVFWRDDGTPTTSAGGGHTLITASPMWYAGNLSSIKFISATGGVIVSFYQ